MESITIEFKGMPLFQKAVFNSPQVMQGTLESFACFFYMVEGSMVSYDARGAHRISEKEAITKNCGSYVQKFIHSQETEKCEAIAIYLYPELLQEIYKNEIPNFIISENTKMPKKQIGNKLIEHYMNNLILFFEDPETLDEELGILKLKELIMILLRSENQESVRNLLSEIFSPINIQLKEVIQNNLFNPLQIEELAFICNMSLSTFKREFKKTFNSSPAKYIKEQRLENAASLLMCDDKSIRDIAFDCGFQDVTTFSDSFHQKYGKSPSQFRKNQIRK